VMPRVPEIPSSGEFPVTGITGDIPLSCSRSRDDRMPGDAADKLLPGHHRNFHTAIATTTTAQSRHATSAIADPVNPRLIG
jgi:hypothetical protein